MDLDLETINKPINSQLNLNVKANNARDGTKKATITLAVQIMKLYNNPSSSLDVYLPTQNGSNMKT